VVKNRASASPNRLRDVADTDQETIDRITLARTHRVGPVSYAQLVARFGTAGAALRVLPDLARRTGGSPPKSPSAVTIEQEMKAVAKAGGRYLFVNDADYPPLLRETHGAPPVLIIAGDTTLLRRQIVAIVGARNASAAACRLARSLAAELGERQITIASGLARGIDTAAHQGALNSGTVGVIASGLDKAFPPENAALQQQLMSEHLVITEFPPGTEPLARHFPHRNRIIAWMSIGTIVVEAAPRSGSLLTARLANEAGRDVMAVPGSPLDPRAQGCNALIREGATLIQNADDVLEAIGQFARPPENQRSFVFDSAEPDDNDRQMIADLLGPVPVSIDELIRQSGLPSSTVQTVLVELEIAGRLDRHAGGRVAAT
jgi:DNA processing protein